MKTVFIASIGILVCTAFLGGTMYFHRNASAPVPPHGIPLSWSSNERAIPKLQAELQGDPKNADWNAALGQAYLQKARETGDPTYYSRAEGLFSRALATKHDHVAALIGKASLAMSRHEFRMARDLAQEAIRINPDMVASYGVLTDALVELGEYDSAVRTLDKMIHLKPNLSSYSRISYLRELNGDIDGAMQTMQMAIDAGSPDGENTAWCMVQLGNLYLASGHLAEADTQFRSALAHFPDYIHAYGGLARLAVAQKDFIAAMHFYQRAIEGVPLPEFIIGLGDVYVHLGRTGDAEQQWTLLRAIEKMYRANGVNTDLEMVLFDVDHGGNLNAALRIIRNEWNLRKSVKVADAYAWTLYRSGRIEEAREMMKQALRLGTKDPLFLMHGKQIG
jgi:tetratricopeptide (TPR) repeat protein